MIGPQEGSARPPEGPAVAALVLRCRPAWRTAFALSAVFLLSLGAGMIAGRIGGLERPWVAALGPPVLFLTGGGCAWFTARFCMSRLVLDDRGFRLAGPLGTAEVAWGAVSRFERRPGRGGPATLRIVFGPDRRRLSIPLVYEDSHLLELGLAQGGFPRY